MLATNNTAMKTTPRVNPAIFSQLEIPDDALESGFEGFCEPMLILPEPVC